jgi:hypothetical protein
METKPPPEAPLQRLLELTQADRRSPAYVPYAGLAAYDHRAVLEALSDDLTEARRLHRTYIRLGVISPPAYTTRDNRTVRCQFVYAARISELLAEQGQEATVGEGVEP